jgi:tripartite-type tricarboxylate transporter receptor subunit TctC
MAGGRVTAMVHCLVAVLSLVLMASDAFAQPGYPERTIRMVVGFPPGGPSDIVARLMADKLSDVLGKPVVIENVSGAAGNTAADRVAKATPDGYTLMLTNSGPFVVNPSLYQKLPFDPVRDFIPISQICFTPNILVVNNEVPAKTVQDLVALARAQPGKMSFASGGAGTTNHLAGELLKFMAGIDITHIPYRGVSVSVPDLLAGRVPMAFLSIPVGLPLVRDGRLRPLAVTSLQRWSAAPAVPTMEELGFPGFDATVWYALMAPAGTPAAIVDRLQRETVRVLTSPDLRKKFDEQGLAVIGGTSAALAEVIRTESAQWAKVIQAAGLKAAE